MVVQQRQHLLQMVILLQEQIKHQVDHQHMLDLSVCNPNTKNSKTSNGGYNGASRGSDNSANGGAEVDGGEDVHRGLLVLVDQICLYIT